MTFSRRADQLLNPLIDAADTLLTVQSADDAWLKSVALVQQNGGNALNVVEIETATLALIWFQSSMDAGWLDDFFCAGILHLRPADPVRLPREPPDKNEPSQSAWL